MLTFSEFKNSPSYGRVTGYEYPFPTGSLAATLPSMAAAEVVEYTDEFDGCDSSSIDHVWYNFDTERLTVRFRRGGGSPGGVYSYDGVKPELYDEFDQAESLGQFHRKYLRETPDGSPWPGIKHNDRTVTFRKIEPQPPVALADLDALKPSAITTGRGKKFGLHFTYSGEGDMVVRSTDMETAIETFEKYMNDHGFEVTVTSVTIDLT